MKDYDDLCGWAMSQKFSVNSFEWIEETSQFNKDFIENYNERISNEGYFVEFHVYYPKNLHKLHSHLPFFLKNRRLKMSKSI